ncbi:replication initiation protein [Actinomadura chibensis]|uniref:Replication initiation protein n=2 Tax=Actinomadura chibensis TaxID=392828 RepID=A0A5D0P0B3_9ACTN|nr:replication initiator [Actinomadura chibensis]TYB50042.1 replication initiation protein [Actinomadura chibensis]
MAKIIDRADFERWAARARATGGCSQPVYLTGTVEHVHAGTGELLHRYTTDREPDGALPVACKTRRASRCPACAEIYRADTYQLIRAGLAGGKGIPDSVAGHPAAFVTLTAPSFGPVHARRVRNGGQVERCRPRRDARPCPHGVVPSCAVRHGENDPRLGEPLCPDCYDYAGSVLFNALAPELWRRFTLALRRYLAKSARLTHKEFRETLAVSFAKVAEYQRRGVVHFHAVIRFDGPDGPATSPPEWATVRLLDDAVRHAAGAVSVTTPAASSMPARSLSWGAQVDVRAITASGALTQQAVAGYIAKYATKAAECVGTLDRRLRPADELATLPITSHARRLIGECLRLGALDEFADLRLVQWAHMLGFRGHFSTKSRRYSTTLGALRAARIAYAREQFPGWQPPDDQDPELILTIGEWRFHSQGLTRGEALVTAALTGRPLPPSPDTTARSAA